MSQILTLLQVAMALLVLVSQTPNISQSMKDYAVQVANQAIETATSYIQTNGILATPTPSPVAVVQPTPIVIVQPMPIYIYPSPTAYPIPTIIPTPSPVYTCNISVTKTGDRTVHVVWSSNYPEGTSGTIGLSWTMDGGVPVFGPVEIQVGASGISDSFQSAVAYQFEIGGCSKVVLNP